MAKAVSVFLALAIGLSASFPATADDGSDVLVSSRDSHRLQVRRARASLQDERIRLRGWVKPTHIGDSGVPGQLKLEVWKGARCAYVRHIRWFHLTRRFMGHFAADLPRSEDVTEIRIYHVAGDDTSDCPEDPV